MLCYPLSGKQPTNNAQTNIGNRTTPLKCFRFTNSSSMRVSSKTTAQ